MHPAALYKSSEELAKKIDEYFLQFDEKKLLYTKPTITGLALHLGFCSRQSLYDYGKIEEFSYIIRRARTCIETVYENNLHFNNPTGSIFALKNMGWNAEKESSLEKNIDTIKRVIVDERDNNKKD
jgi:hypothetical protein|tara:strand:- start:58 stop:435 length:378 start_codon:yes stop_codon:yes gene_type:complete